ncbi:hypothetical protein [Rufibacter sp. LB8]|uniref:hypothetical protein n=1 Tax=Rufibacter sp. LB8 TaxID=2777781 RepID=UPI00178C1B27|nr:hypothetical protein [Rufibacter sp. LB8]
MKKLLLVCISFLLFHCTHSQQIKLDDHGVSVTLDDNWSYSKLSNDTYVLKYKCEQDAAFCKNIVIRVIKNTNKETLEQVAQTIVETLPSRYEAYKLVSVKGDTIEGKEYKVIDYIIKEKDIHLGNTTVVTRRNNDLILFHFAGLNQPKGNFLKERNSFFAFLAGVQIEHKNENVH